MNNLAFFELYLPKVCQVSSYYPQKCLSVCCPSCATKDYKESLDFGRDETFSKLGKAKWKRDWVLVLAFTKSPYAKASTPI